MTAPAAPTADDAAQAVVMARRLFPRHTPYSRIEMVALAAMLEAYPEAPPADVMALVGLDGDWDPTSEIERLSRQSWFREDLVNEIVGELVAPLYGAQAQ